MLAFHKMMSEKLSCCESDSILHYSKSGATVGTKPRINEWPVVWDIESQNRIIELFRLEKTFKIIESNH